MSDRPTTPSAAIIEEAAGWLVRMTERALTPSEQLQLAAWRQQSPQHEHAWQAARQFSEMLGQVPSDVGKRVLGRTRADRRAVLRGIAGLAIATPVAGLAWNRWPMISADLRTATGEQRQVTLPDGSQLQMNTATRLNILFSDSERMIQLVEGEVLVRTAPDPSPAKRPFVVDTSHGRIRALGTRFSVRETGQGVTRVYVFEDAVVVRAKLADAERRLEAGQALTFDRRHPSQPIQHSQRAPSWVRGQLLSDNQRLADFVAELARYRPGLLRCDPAVADLRISGVFQVKSTDQVLEILEATLPVRIQRVTDYWVTVTAR